MEKKVGKRILIFLLLLISHCVFASESAIVLRMQDMNHEPIDQAMCQAPFILQVELKNIDGYNDIHLMQYITGIENFKKSRSMTSQNVTIDNGRQTVKAFYNFVLRTDKKGKFTVGPLMLKDKTGQPIRSNRLIIPVGDEIISSQASQKDKYFMTATLDRKQVYVGEKLSLSVKFYDRLFVDDLHLKFPDFKNLYIVKSQNVVHKSTVVIDEEEYCATEWVFDLYPTQSGPLILQDIHAAFFAPKLENKFTFGGVFDFFRPLHKTEQYIVAQPIKAEIMPLPVHQKFHDVIAVGQFLKFVISTNQDSAPVGQGIVFTIELFGNANFEMIPSAPLILPEGFKYYDSNMVTINEQRNHKSYDFIVQADVADVYHIEPQTFIYFDPVDKIYKKLESNAFDITITPAAFTDQPQHVQEDLLDESIEENISTQKKLKDFSIVQKGSVHKPLQIIIPLNLYQQFLWLLFFIWFLLGIYRGIVQKYFFHHPAWNKFIIFVQVKKRYDHAQSKKATEQLHAIFIQLFSGLMQVNTGQLHKTVIVEYLAEKDFSLHDIQMWNEFYEQILKSSFSSHIQEPQQDLFEQALQWIQQLKEKA